VVELEARKGAGSSIVCILCSKLRQNGKKCSNGNRGNTRRMSMGALFPRSAGCGPKKTDNAGRLARTRCVYGVTATLSSDKLRREATCYRLQVRGFVDPHHAKACGRSSDTSISVSTLFGRTLFLDSYVNSSLLVRFRRFSARLMLSCRNTPPIRHLCRCSAC
jgi:hypothetical protein